MGWPDDDESTPLAAAPDEPAPRRDGTVAGLLTALALPLFHVVTNVWLASWPWLQRGSGDAAHIVRGQWWRLVTALTLHGDWSHAANNAVSTALFVTAVCRWFGAGVGLWLVMLAGAGGNLINAYARGADHVAIGFSTAVFGAVGVLTTLQLARRWAPHTGGLARMRAWAPLAAGLALLAVLGSSRNSDVAAHLFGFLCGAVLGFLANRVRAERTSAGTQALLTVALVLAVAACWWLAL